jgi:hypothetical protein
LLYLSLEMLDMHFLIQVGSMPCMSKRILRETKFGP